MTLKELFLEYITNYSFGKPRVYPANPKTIGRQKRALDLVEKLIEKPLDDVTNQDQLVFMERIRGYAQGTRTVTTHTFQRFLWWALKEHHIEGQNLVKGNEEEIIGDPTPVKYASMTQQEVEYFLRKIKDQRKRLLLYVVYLTGLDSSEVIEIRKEDVTPEHLVVRRMKLGTTQILTLPKWLQEELFEYSYKISDPQGRLFGIEPHSDLREQRDSEINVLWKQCTIETGLFQHTQFRDFRINAIRHYYFQTKDMGSVKAFAGVPPSKKGWLELLLTDQDVYLKDRLLEREINHG